MKKTITILIAIVVISAIGIFYINRSNDSQNLFIENGKTYKQYTDPNFGINFSYRVEPDGYTLDYRTIKEGENYKDIAQYIILANSQDYVEFINSTIPRGGPPMISIIIFKNTQDLKPKEWLSQNSFIANYIEQNELSQVEVSGKEGVRYSAGGMYQDDTIILSNESYVYMIIGSYDSPNDQIRKDFLEFIETINIL